MVEVTVAVPAYNAARTLPTLLAALAGQRTERSFEVIVVDDGSTDETGEVLARWVASQPGIPVRLFRQENAGPAVARNRAAREGTGGAILFTDSDCTPRPDWVETLAACLAAHPEAGAVGGSYDIANPESWLAKLIHAEIRWRHADMGPWIRFAGSYNLAVRRKVFDALGGFSERYRNASGEDNDFSYRILGAGWKLRFCPQARVAHHHTERLAKYLREQYRHGKWRATLYREHPAMVRGDDYTRWTDVADVPLALGTLAVALFALLFGRLGWAVPACLVALVVLKAVQGAEVSRHGGGAAVFAFVAAARAFARSLGFVAGLARSLSSRPGTRNTERGALR